MKKLLLALVAVLAVFTFAGCSSESDKPTYASLSLTEENYSDYIAVNTYFSDFQYSISSDSTDTFTRYDLACVGHLETSPKKKFLFDDVTIRFSISYSGIYTASACTVRLDINGYSHGSFSCRRENSSIFAPPTQPINISILEISGYVLVYNEA